MPLTGSNSPLLAKAARLCRTVAVALYAGVRRGRSFNDHEADIAAAPLKTQIFFTVAILLALLACSIFAAQFGLIGLAVFWLGVIILVR